MNLFKKFIKKLSKKFFKEPFYICTYICYRQDSSSEVEMSGSFPSYYKELESVIGDCKEYLERNTPNGYVCEYKLYEATLLERLKI